MKAKISKVGKKIVGAALITLGIGTLTSCYGAPAEQDWYETVLEDENAQEESSGESAVVQPESLEEPSA